MADLFNSGRVCVTPNAQMLLGYPNPGIGELLDRHLSGDWGDLDGEDKKANKLALKEGLRLLSAYTLSSGTKIWIITEADRSVTTILLPEEY